MLLLFIITIIVIYYLVMKFFINKDKQPKTNNQTTDILPDNIMKYAKLLKKEKTTKFPDKNRLIDIIKQKYVHPQYSFNLPNNPLVTRYPVSQPSSQDDKYLKYINKDIMQWNNILNMPIDIKDIQPVIVVEAGDEFLIKVNVKINYFEKSIYLQLSYYGLAEKMDDFFANQNTTYQLQMVDIIKIDADEYQSSKKPIIHEAPFMTMLEQMAYVDQINKIHENEY